VWIGLLSLWMAQVSLAQRYSFKHYGPEEGLKTAVNRLLQDRDGFLWVGTSNGLFRYDGERFQRFGTVDGLPSNSVRYIHQTADGALWVVTGGGLARLRNNRFERLVTGLADEPEALFDMDSDRGGHLYVSSSKGLLLGEQGLGGALTFRFAGGAPKIPVQGVHVDPEGAVWFGCGQNLCRLAEEGWNQVFGPRQGLPKERWNAVLFDHEGNLWVRGLQRLYVRPAGALKFIARDSGLPQSSNSAVDLAIDSAGTVLISTDLGLARWVDGAWALVGSKQGLPSDTVSSVLQDREGSVWIGLWGTGLARWLGYGEWTSWTTHNGLSNNIVWAIRRQRSGGILAGTDNGLVRIGQSGKTRARTWTTRDGLGNNKVKAIVIGADGAAWIGTSPGGISRLDPVTDRIRTYGAESGLADAHVVALYIDAENRLWVSTAGGLFRSTPLDHAVQFERQTPPSTKGHELYFRFLGDRAGRIWVGSMTGLFRWDRGRWTRFTQADGLKSNAVTHVAETPDGAVWIGYREPIGLSRLTFPGGKRRWSITRRPRGLRPITCSSWEWIRRAISGSAPMTGWMSGGAALGRITAKMMDWFGTIALPTHSSPSRTGRSGSEP
jgi:ligand-binding sensor domain-containing protein